MNTPEYVQELKQLLSPSLDKAIKSPSKHIPLSRLNQIKQDGSIGASGQEYSEEELNDSILDRKISDADRMVREADRMQAYRPKMKKVDKIPGGLAEGKKPSDFPKLRIKQGKKVEMEHTSDPKIAEEIAMDHLTEDPKYYDKLKTIEKSEEDHGSTFKSKYPYVSGENVHSVVEGRDEAMHQARRMRSEGVYASIWHHSGPKTGPKSKYYITADKKMAKAELQKMSRPRLTFPKFEGTSSRPDQEIQGISTKRQQDMFGRKVANADIRDQKKVRRSNMTQHPDGTFSHGPDTFMDYSQQPLRDKRSAQVSRKFDRNSLGLLSPTKTGPKGAAIEGKLRSKFENIEDDGYNQKLEDHRQKRNSLVQDYNNKYLDWQKKAYELSNKDLTVPENRQAYEEHRLSKPVKPKLPRKPSKPKIDTSELSPEKQKLRGQAMDSTREHEGFHYVMEQIGRNYGPRAVREVQQKLIAQHDPKALGAVASFIQRLGYKTKSPYFNEEVLAHARDILVNPAKRQKFKEHVGSDVFDAHIKNLKQGHQKAYKIAQSIAPEEVGAVDMKTPTKLAASESMKKAPAQYEPKVISSMPIKSLKNPVEVVSKELPNGLVYKQFRGPHDYEHQLFHPEVGHPVAEVVTSTDDHGNENSTQDHTITWAQVHPDHVGKGFGKQLYLATLTHGKGVGRINSDKTTSQNAEKTWDHVLKQPGVSGKKAPWLSNKDAENKSVAEVDKFMRQKHQAVVSDRSKLDQGKMFPDVGIKDKKLAASENGKKDTYPAQHVWEHRIKFATPKMSAEEWNHPQNFDQKNRVFQYPEYNLVRVPIDHLKIDDNHPSSPLSDAEDESYAHRYASLKTPAPAILAHPTGDGKWQVKDGRHRTRAAAIRGDTHVLAYIPKVPK